jgi:ribosomal protein S18 acetylase RimI-like enzyme
MTDAVIHSETPVCEWLDRVAIRTMLEGDLPALEWEGEFTHFRRLYAEAFQRTCSGLAQAYVAQLTETGIIAQSFIQLTCDRQELADGAQRAYLYAFRVRPAYRCKGLGTRMMDHFEDELRKRGFRWLTLNVGKDNPRAQKLYRRRGYTVIAHEPGIWNYPDESGVWRQVIEPAWRMEKELK